jgi:hypothetical protein
MDKRADRQLALAEDLHNIATHRTHTAGYARDKNRSVN